LLEYNYVGVKYFFYKLLDTHVIFLLITCVSIFTKFIYFQLKLNFFFLCSLVFYDYLASCGILNFPYLTFLFISQVAIAVKFVHFCFSAEKENGPKQSSDFTENDNLFINSIYKFRFISNI